MAIAAGSVHTVGLKSDGTVFVVSNSEHGVCDVSDWKNIVAIETDISGWATVGLRADGAVLFTSDPKSGRERRWIYDWKPFNNINTIERETSQAKENLRQKEARRVSLENEKSRLNTEYDNLRGLFTGKRRKEILNRLSQIYKELERL